MASSSRSPAATACTLRLAQSQVSSSWTILVLGDLGDSYNFLLDDRAAAETHPCGPKSRRTGRAWDHDPRSHADRDSDSQSVEAFRGEWRPDEQRRTAIGTGASR